MCDEFTEATGPDVTRREFAAMGALAALVACSGASKGGAPRLTEATVRIPTLDGMADAFFVHPARGRYPGVILWPDIGGLRDAFKLMARRLASAGYAVLAVNQYYRSAPAPVLTSFAEWRTPEGQAKLKPMIAAVTPFGIVRDTAGFVGFLDEQASVDKARKIGTQGYCMGGPFAIRAAAAAPRRIGAAASFHGAGLVGTAPDSPSQLIAKSQARFLIAIGRNDDQRAPGDKDALRRAADAAKRVAEIEVYPADHGWCVPDTPIYDQVQAERAWGRLLALYGGL
jgi:carboxymethylenebutenolidase